MSLGRLMSAAVFLCVSSWTASTGAHDGETDAGGCHGRELTGIDHCHVEAVPLQNSENASVNVADARRGIRELQLPECFTCEDVTTIQRGLAALGHSPGPIDGIIGPLTRSAIESYQRAQDLPVDGVATEGLAERLSVAN